jgi:hypothetical protein
VSVVDVVDPDTSTAVMRVTHDYRPSPATPNLYEVIVTIENLGAAAIEPRYRRVMDWDIEPSAFSEYVTIQGTAGADNVLFANSNGFETADPLVTPDPWTFEGDAVDEGPNDHGALFDFGFDSLPAGESMSFNTYYGAAGNETAANAALAAVGAEVYSYGQPSYDYEANEPLDPTIGSPNTFIFAFAGVGGEAVFPAARFTSATYSAAESAGSATIGVELTAAPTAPMTVDYATSDGTATAGSDYTASSGTLSFGVGETAKTFAVPILDDALVEGDETVNLTLSNPTGGLVLGSPSTAVLTITDDDTADPSAKATSTTYTGATTVQYSDPAALSATLLDTSVSPAVGVAAKTIGFTLGSQSTSAGPTGSDGTAGTSLTVTQAPAVVSVAAAFAGDAAYLASSDTASFTILKEDCTLAYTGASSGAAGTPTTLSAQFGELDSSPGSWNGKTIVFDVVDGAMGSTQYTATTNAAGVASTTASLPAGAYGVTASFAGDTYYTGCGAAEQLLVVSDVTHGKVTGGGFVVDNGRTSFGFNASSADGVMSGQLQMRAPGGRKLHGSTVTALSVDGSSATWSGEGRWLGRSGATFDVTVTDAGKVKGKKTAATSDTWAIVVRDSTGATVFTASGPLKGGNITVH